MVHEFSISEAEFNEDGDVKLTFKGLKRINMGDVRLLESTPRLLKALKAAYWYINSSERDLSAVGKAREDYIYEFNSYCPDLDKIGN